MIFSRKFPLGMFQRSVRNFCPKIVRNEGKSVRKLNARNFNVRKFLQVMYVAIVFTFHWLAHITLLPFLKPIRTSTLTINTVKSRTISP